MLRIRLQVSTDSQFQDSLKEATSLHIHLRGIEDYCMISLISMQSTIIAKAPLRSKCSDTVFHVDTLMIF